LSTVAFHGIKYFRKWQPECRCVIRVETEFIHLNCYHKEWGMARKEISYLVIVVLVGLILQVGLVALDCTQAPYKTAVSYVKARYGLCPSMASYLCGGSGESCDKNESTKCSSGADDYIYEATADAAERGFDKGVAKYALSHIETHTEYIDDTNTTAVVHLTATRRMAINPLYAYVASIFSIGETYEVEESVRLKKKNGQWRVCGSSNDI
jgi:hypothetical protein